MPSGGAKARTFEGGWLALPTVFICTRGAVAVAGLGNTFHHQQHRYCAGGAAPVQPFAGRAVPPLTASGGTSMRKRRVAPKFLRAPQPRSHHFAGSSLRTVRGPSFFLVGWVSAPITGERQGRCMWSVRHRVHCHKSLGTCKHCCGTVYTVRHDCRDAHWPKNKNNTKVAARELRSVAERTKQGYPWFS